MTQSGTHIEQVATIVGPVMDQDAALAFYVEILGMQKVNDFTYPTGERWLEVLPAKASSNLCLVASRPERPAGIETGVVLFSADGPRRPSRPPSPRGRRGRATTARGQRGVVERRTARRRPNAVSPARSRRQLLPHRRRALLGKSLAADRPRWSAGVHHGAGQPAAVSASVTVCPSASSWVSRRLVVRSRARRSASGFGVGGLNSSPVVSMW